MHLSRCYALWLYFLDYGSRAGRIQADLLLAGLLSVLADDLRLLGAASAVAVASSLADWQRWEDQIQILVAVASDDLAGPVGELGT